MLKPNSNTVVMAILFTDNLVYGIKHRMHIPLTFMEICIFELLICLDVVS